MNAQDLDPVETREWLESLADVLEHDGAERARFLLEGLLARARQAGAAPATVSTTPYVNTIPVEAEPEYPGDLALEAKLLAFLRWNAMAMVVKANRDLEGIGGHIATYQSIAQLFEVGFHHFWHTPSDGHGGDLVYFQGHASPGIYARAYLEGRLSAEQISRFRQEVEGGLPSYPHPWLMPEFWQFATVSMGLGPLMAIYQARFLKYLHARGLADTAPRRVWAFMGDGEMDEPESIGAITVASRERLDNLIFVVNCNLQRLDGPVRGNAKIIQELEGVFTGAGWQVLKVVWGSEWDALLAADHDGRLQRRMLETVDGEWQNYAARGPAYFRERFFGTDPELAARVAQMTDADLASLSRGGHDPRKVYAAYQRAMASEGRPTLILAHTVKGYGMGSAGEGLNISHQQKKMPAESILAFRDRFQVPILDAELEGLGLAKPADDSPELRYLQERRAALGGGFPQRRKSGPPLPIPELAYFESMLGATAADREISTTQSFVRALALLLRDKQIKDRLVPIIADEARTFGMEGLFRQIGIYSVLGQLYEPVDAEQVAFYKEAKNGQVLQEGINEAGSLASWIAAGVSYSTSGLHMIPFFIFYSMFGFQRVGDLIWAAADMQARGFLLGATSGRTTLNGEGLQHEDGHSHLMASTVPNCVAYDPTFQYEVAVILQDGLRRMFGEADESVFYYLTLLNENYPQPAMPEGAEEGIRRGMYQLRPAPEGAELVVQLLGSGAILREVQAAAEMLETDWGVGAQVWSCPSFTELRREGLACDRRSLLHPEDQPSRPWVATCLADTNGPVIAATDYQKTYADLVRPWIPRRYVTLGTDGFGRSDSRAQLRHFFEVDRRWVTVAALKALADDGALPLAKVREALEKYGIDPEKADPTTV
jgi:pyruvate dehydrogenase E1 component